MSERAIPEADAEIIRQSIFAGRKIEAIKHLREVSNLDLRDAKTMVEQLEHDLRAASPEKFTATPARGCSVGLGAFLAAIILAAGYLLV